MPFADMVRNRPERGTRCGCQVHKKSLTKTVHRPERLITSSDWANLEMHAYYLRHKRRLSGCTLVMYWDTVYTRSTHGLRVTLVRITPEEPPLTQTHSHSTHSPPQPRTGRTAAAPPCRRSASPRPRAARLHRDEHGREQLVHERIRLRDHVHTSAPAAATRLARVAWFPRVTTAAASDPFARPHKSLHQECTASTTHDTKEL